MPYAKFTGDIFLLLHENIKLHPAEIILEEVGIHLLHVPAKSPDLNSNAWDRLRNKSTFSVESQGIGG